MFFDGEAYDNWRLSKEERELADSPQGEKDDAADSDAKKDKKDKKGKDADKKKDDTPKVKPLTFDLDNREERVACITPNSAFLGDFILSPDGRKLYYAASFESGIDLWEHDLDDRSSKIVVKGLGYGELIPDAKIDNLYLATGSGIKKLDIKSKTTKPVNYAAEFTYRPAKEREYIFNHAWRQVNDKFYDPAIHGIDSERLSRRLRPLPPHINNNYDFQELLSEMLGELNGSHTGARFYGNMADTNTPRHRMARRDLRQRLRRRRPPDRRDCSHGSDGQGFCQDQARHDHREHRRTACQGRSRLLSSPLSGKSGKQVMLQVKDPSTGKTFEQQIKASNAGDRSNLLYRRWVERNRAIVDSLSSGRVGYIHIKGMDSPSFRQTFHELLGRYRNCDAVVIDTRHNGGGWLHEDLAILLSGTKFATFEPPAAVCGSGSLQPLDQALMCAHV